MLKWTPPVIFVAHTIDELISDFPEWATRHFGTTSRRFYVASHVLLIGAVLATSLAADRRRSDRRSQTALGAIAAGFVVNGLFHLETTWRFRELSPGTLTGSSLMIPGGGVIVIRLLRDRRLDKRDALQALAGGALVNAAAVLSLRLDMPTLGSKADTDLGGVHHAHPGRSCAGVPGRH